jgi:hypothetical protein
MEAVVLAVELQYVCYACSEVRGREDCASIFQQPCMCVVHRTRQALTIDFKSLIHAIHQRNNDYRQEHGSKIELVFDVTLLMSDSCFTYQACRLEQHDVVLIRRSA